MVIINNKCLLSATIFFVAFFMCSLSVDAQSSRRHYRYSYSHRNTQASDSLSANVKEYVDSLRNYKQWLDEAIKSNDSLRQVLDARAKREVGYSRLLSPLSFSHDAARGAFSLDGSNTTERQQMIAGAMMNIYLNHPELVSGSDSKLPKVIEADKPAKKPARQEELLTEEAPQAAVNENLAFGDPVVLFATKPNFWTFKGDYTLQFMQNFFTGNWYKGGDSYYSMIATAALQANYDDKGKVKWDNKLELKLGFMTSPSDTINDFKTTEDLIRLTSKLGIQAKSKWYYTLQMIANTQFTHGLKSNDTKIYSDFMSPFNLNVSLGMEYKVSWLKKKLTGTINLSPLAYNFKYVGRLDLATRYSLEEGHHTLNDFGSTMTVNLSWKPSDKFKWESRLYAYTTYKKVEAEWENTITFKLTKYISTNLFLHPRFDDSTKRDDKLGYLQFKEYLSFGFSYSF